MAKKKKDAKMTQEALGAAITQQIQQAVPSESSKLSRAQAKLMEEYLGRPYGDEVADRSSVVTREVLETIEWTMPQLMRIFQGGDDVVQFDPQGPEDVPLALQATEYVNYVFNLQNPGFKITYQWIKDGLLQKNGIVKIHWEDAVEKRETYELLDEEELQLLLSEDDVRVSGDIEEETDQHGVTLGYNVAILRASSEGKTKVENVPPEEFIISMDAKDIQSAPFVAHRPLVSISDLTEMGFDVSDLPTGGDDDGQINSDLRLARFEADRTGGQRGTHSDAADETQRQVRLTESYIRVDFNNDGISELRQVFSVGGTVLKYKDSKKYANEEVNWIPFAGWTPIIMSHKFYGLSMGELVNDIQKINSQLFRNMLDNQYLAIHGKYAVLDGMVNMDDMQTGTPHGIVREKMAGAVRRIDVPQLNPAAFQMLELTQRMSETRTGVSARTQGLDESQLNPNTAATAVNQVMTAAQQRLELIARVFGETGFTDLFNLIYATEIAHQSKEKMVRLRNEYIPVDPSSWKERKDLSVVVGLGNGSKDAQMFQLNTIFQAQMQLLSQGKVTIVGDMQLFNTANDQAKLFNPSADNRYFQDPSSPEGQQAAQAQQQQQQQAEQMQQMQVQLAQQELKIQEFIAQSKAQNDQMVTDIKQQAQDLAVQSQHDNIAIDIAELGLEAEQDRPVGIGK